MESDKSAVLLLLVIGVLGLALIGVGVTGKVVMGDSLYKEICSSNNECKAPDVCCKFYQESSGVCNGATYCESIKQMTTNEKSVMEKWKGIVVENPQTNLYNGEVILGIILIIVVLIVIYILTKKNAKEIESKKQKSKKKIIKKKKR